MQRNVVDYQCLKAILMQMEANLRIQCAQRIPFIRSTEKLVPLKINHLSFGYFSTTINGAEYRLGVYRDYHSGEIPKIIKKENEEGGVQMDLDQYGCQYESGFSVLLEGDVSFRDENHQEYHMHTNNYRRLIEQRLQYYENVLQIKLDVESEGVTFEEYLARDYPFSLHPDDEIEGYMLMYLYHSIDWLRDELERNRTQLLSFYYRRHKMAVPYTPYLQLTLTKDGAKKIQRFPYKQKLFKAEKQLRDIMFGDRRATIIVNEFEEFDKTDVYRLPIGFRMGANVLKVTNLRINHEGLHSIFDDLKFETLKMVSFGGNIEDFQNEIVENATKLVASTFTMQPAQLTLFLENSQLLEFHMREWYAMYTAEEFYEILVGWIQNKSIRSVCSFELRESEENVARQLLKLIRARWLESKRSKRCVTVKLSDSERLEVFYVPVQKSIFVDYFPLGDRYKTKWCLKMRIVKV